MSDANPNVYFVVAAAETGEIQYAARAPAPLSDVIATWPLAGCVVVQTSELMRDTRGWIVVDGAIVVRET